MMISMTMVNGVFGKYLILVKYNLNLQFFVGSNQIPLDLSNISKFYRLFVRLTLDIVRNLCS